MEYKDAPKTINWLVFTFLILIGVITGFSSMMGLDQAPQSRFDFSWDSTLAIITVTLFIFSIALGIGWKRLFPFNVPIALMIIGGWYFFIFITFVTGWVGILGMIGLAIGFAAGLLLIILHSVVLFIKFLKDKNV